MNAITVSAPGKLLLFGEHAVVHNHPAIVTAVNQWLFVTLEKSNDGIFSLIAPDVKINAYQKSFAELTTGEIPLGAQFIEHATARFVDRFPSMCKGIAAKTTSQFSSEFGFGSSSASTVSTLFGLNELYQTHLSSQELFEMAYRVVLEVSKKGSGFDIASALCGGVVYFFTGGKEIRPLYVPQIPLMVGYTGVKTNTATIVTQVEDLKAQYPDRVSQIFDEIETIVKKAEPALLSGDWKTVGDVMNENQIELQKLGVSSEKLDAMCNAARSAGAWGAKLSGAGVGDCMIAVVPDEAREAVAKAIEAVGGQVVPVKTQAEGVRVEKSGFSLPSY